MADSDAFWALITPLAQQTYNAPAYHIAAKSDNPPFSGPFHRRGGVGDILALFLECGGPKYTKFGNDIGPSSALSIHVLYFRYDASLQMRLVSKIDRPRSGLFAHVKIRGGTGEMCEYFSTST